MGRLENALKGAPTFSEDPRKFGDLPGSPPIDKRSSLVAQIRHPRNPQRIVAWAPPIAESVYSLRMGCDIVLRIPFVYKPGGKIPAIRRPVTDAAVVQPPLEPSTRTSFREELPSLPAPNGLKTGQSVVNPPRRTGLKAHGAPHSNAHADCATRRAGIPRISIPAGDIAESPHQLGSLGTARVAGPGTHDLLARRRRLTRRRPWNIALDCAFFVGIEVRPHAYGGSEPLSGLEDPKDHNSNREQKLIHCFLSTL
jgi:hypothetical protein